MSDRLLDDLQARLAEAYIVERELGGGGMSRVFVAQETALGRTVVVKVLPPEIGGELSAERFRREIQLAARLQHPHIVPVLSAGSAGTLLYYTMPLIDGETLRARLQRSGELPIQDTVRLARELADALSYAHESGIVHRDLKPENILVSRSHAFVADFGVAKAVTESALASSDRSPLTSVGLALGTPAYMAPEQAAADPAVDHRADIYALGCVLYELLTGTPPFSGRPTPSLLAAHIAERPEPVVNRRPATPAPLAQLVMSMLEKRPADRPQTADEIIASLDALGSTVTISADNVQASSASVRASTGGTAVGRLGDGGKPLTAWRIGVIGGVVAGIALVAVVITTLGSRRPSTDDAGGAVPFAITAGDPTDASAAHTSADAAIRDYLADAVTTFDNARLVTESSAARFLITESSTPLGRDSLLVRVRLVESGSGKVLRAFAPVRAAVADPVSALESLRGKVRAAVGMVVHPMLGAAALPSTDSPNEAAFGEFSSALAGVDRLLSGSTSEREKVADQLRRSHELDSTFLQPVVWLAFVQSQTFSGRRAADSMLANALAQHQGRLTVYERDLAEVLVSSLRGDNAASLRSSARLYRTTPAEWTAQAHARALLQFARYRSAIAILDSLSPAATADDPQFWADYVRAHHQLGDHSRELSIARRAVRIMPERRGVRSFEIHALIALDSADAALKAIDDAILLPEERDVSGSVVTTLATASIEFDAHGNERAASRVRERANAVVLGMSDTERMRFVASLAALGHDSLVLRLAPQFLAADSATFGTRASYAIALINKGDTAGALREISAIERVGSRLRPYVSGADLLARARVAAALGRGSEALSLASQAIAQGQGFNARRQIHAGEEFRSLRNTPEFQKLMRPRDD